MRISFKTLFFTIVCCFFVSAGQAQKPVAKKPVITPVKKYRQPKLYTTLGSYKDSSNVPVDQVLNIINLPLKIVDDKKIEYTITSYQFLYKRRVVTEDEQSGKVSPASSISSGRFTTSPLPELWINTIGQNLIAGEELYFFDVIAKDVQGRVMVASSLKIMVQ
ncbi:hypothetical protein BH11BAC4_BH11BAC4_17220 [soil metagenome]